MGNVSFNPVFALRLILQSKSINEVFIMYHIIVNPASRSGRGQQYWELVEVYLKKHNIPYTAYRSSHSGHIKEIINDVTKDLNDFSDMMSLIILGGDGTVNEALQGITRFDKVRLGYIPTGSSNDFARDLGISNNPIEALQHMLNTPYNRHIDIGCVEYKDCRKNDYVLHKHYFAVSCGLGYDAAICEEAIHSKIKSFLNRCGLGKLTYLIIALKQLACAKPISASLTLNGQKTIPLHNLLFLAGMNHQYEGGGFMFAPGADDHDGTLDLCCVSNVSKLKVLCVLPTAYKGKHFRFKGVDAFYTNTYSLKVSSPMWLHTDGEVPAFTNEISVNCMHKTLQIFY